MRRLIFRAPIFILSASASFLLSAAVAAMISIPTYEKITWIMVVLLGRNSVNVFPKSKNCHVPHPKEDSYCSGYCSLEITILVFDLVNGIEE